jgi:hypothetical protein
MNHRQREPRCYCGIHRIAAFAQNLYPGVRSFPMNADDNPVSGVSGAKTARKGAAARHRTDNK